MMKKIDNFWERVQGSYYNALFHIKEFFIGVKFAYQRAFQGYDDEFFWQFNARFAELMPVLMKRFEEEALGYPHGLRKKEWHRILRDIAKGFEAAKEICEDYGGEKNRKELEKIFRKGMRLFAQHYFDLWD